MYIEKKKKPIAAWTDLDTRQKKQHYLSFDELCIFTPVKKKNDVCVA